MTPDGTVIGQQVSEQTLHDLAAARDRFEPLLGLETETLEVASGLPALVLSVTERAVP